MGGRSILFFGLALSWTLFGCGSTATSSAPVAHAEPPSEAPAKSEASTQDRPTPTTEEEHLDTPAEQDEYTARGIPAIDKTWSVDEAKAAAEAIVRMVKEDPALLPRLSNARSRKVFERLISRDTLHRYQDPRTHLNIRFPAVNDLALVNKQILVTYIKAFEKGQPLSRELLELLVMQGVIAVEMWHVIDELLPQLDPKDPTYPNRMAGLQQVRDGTTEMVEGLLMTLTERRNYGAKDLTWYAEQLVPIVPSLIDRLDPPVRAAMRKRIAELADSEPEPEIKKQLKILLKAVPAR